mgnify:CR=1 FL=1
MRFAQSVAVALFCGASIIPATSDFSPLFAQVAEPEDDDEGEDDSELPDPDDAGSEPPAIVEEEEVEEAPIGAPEESESEPSAPGEEEEDDDASGSSGAAAAEEEDDDDAAGTTAEEDDDDDVAESEEEDDDDLPGAPEEEDDDVGEDLPDDDDDSAVEIIGGGDESDSDRIALDEQDNIETDREGFRYRKNEFVALDLSPSDLTAMRSKGFTVLQTERLLNTGTAVHLLKSPARLSDQDALSILNEITENEILSFNHLFDSSSGEVRKLRKPVVSSRTACGCVIGMIDTAVADRLPLFKHVAIEQKAFNAKLPLPRLHGTAVAHQFAGTVASRGRPTKIVVADIFSGQRASAGSTFALVRALDWLSAKGTGIINVSLAGPRNAVVAGAVERLSRRGHIIVAAAGNDGPAAPPVFPGAYKAVVAVTAVDSSQKIYRYANRGSYIDFAAQGVAVPALNPKGEWTAATGTSFAAPAVAARLARDLARPDVAASARLVAKLEKEARDLGAPGHDTTFGHGLVAVVP